MRLDMQSSREILKANFEEYQRASKKGRTELLDQLVPVTGLNRSYLATALGKAAAGDRTRQKGRRKERPEGKRGGHLSAWLPKKNRGTGTAGRSARKSRGRRMNG
jgi:hypothetical protein